MSGLEDLQGRVMFAREDFSLIYRDGRGGFRMRYILPEGCAEAGCEPWWRFDRCCTLRLCNCEPLRRKHFTFRHCRVRRVAEGRHSADFPIDLHFFTVDKSASRRFPKVKNWLIKRLKSVIEWLGD